MMDRTGTGRLDIMFGLNGLQMDRDFGCSHVFVIFRNTNVKQTRKLLFCGVFWVPEEKILGRL